MKRLVAGIGIIICAIAIFIVGSATVQAQITQNVAQENISAQTQVAINVAQRSPWGSDDEIGTLNMMTDASRLDILKQVASGKVYDLSVDLFVGMPTCCDAFGDPPFQIWMTHIPARGTDKELLSYSGDGISMYTHSGTHIDALNYFGLHGQIWNQVNADDALQGTREFDRLNQILAYLNTDFYSAFNPLWTAYEMQDLEQADRELLRTIGRAEVAKNCAYLDALLAEQEWLLGGKQQTVADAYLTGIGRWVEYHQLFDLQQMYPNLNRYLQRLNADPAVGFAQAIENGWAAKTAGKFMGHVTLEDLHAALQISQGSQFAA